MSEKRKIRFNVIDFIILVAVAALIVTVVLRSGVTENFTEREVTDTVEITFISSGIHKNIASAVQAGDVVTISDTGMTVGTVSDIKVSEYETYTADENGLPVKVSDTEHATLRGTIQCRGIMTDEGFLLNGTLFLAAGSSFGFRTPNACTNLVVLSVRTVS